MKKFVSGLLAIVLCLMISVSAVAADSIEADASVTSFESAVESKIEGVLGAIDLQKEDFGMGSVDFSNLALGNEIPSYELTDKGLVLIDDVHYFPILSGNDWVATAVVTYSAYGEMNVEVSAKYAAAYSALSISTAARSPNATNEVALVFDSTEAYLYSNYDRVLVEQFPEISERATIATYGELIAPETAQVVAHRAIDVQTVAFAQTSRATQDNENFVSLNITPITQPTSYTCWAASTAMLLNYRGESETVNSVVSKANVDLTTYMSVAQCAGLIAGDGINYGYGYPCGTWGESYGYYYSLTLDNLVTELYMLSSPLFAGFASPGYVGHAVVVKGYVNLTGSPTMTYIDPADGYIKAVSIPSSGSITISYGGSSHELAAAFAVYEK